VTDGRHRTKVFDKFEEEANVVRNFCLSLLKDSTFRGACVEDKVRNSIVEEKKRIGLHVSK